MSQKKPPPMIDLEDFECIYYRDTLRTARYAALADAEGFTHICFALEAIGLRLLGQQGDLGQYEHRIGVYAVMSPLLNELAKRSPSHFKSFDALYQIVRNARNDVMHTGDYARHATDAAIELCIGLEEALMKKVQRTVGDLMIKSPIVVEPWQPLALARQLMLMHSFSFLPVCIGGQWHLVSELAVAKYLNQSQRLRGERLANSIKAAKADGMELTAVERGQLLDLTMTIDAVLATAKVKDGPMLWLVKNDQHPEHLAGVLSPFELM
jgi:hypothetical protein